MTALCDYRQEMPSFRILFTVLSTLVLAQVLPAQPLWTLEKSCFLLLVASMIFLCICKHRTRDLVRRAVQLEPDTVGPHRLEAGATFDATRNIVQSLWGWSYPLVLGVTGWLSWAVVAKESGLNFLFAICLFAPHLMFCVTMEWLSARMDGLCGENLWARLRLRLRFGELASVLVCLTPFLVISGFVDLAALGVGRSASVWLQAGVGVAVLLLATILYPILFGKWTGVSQLTDPEASDRCEALLVRAGIKNCKLLEVSSDGTWNSAAIVGWMPWTRQLWLGDSLLRRLKPEELDMVVLHEAAHIRCHHFAFRMLPLLWSILTGSVTLLTLNLSLGPGWWTGTISLIGAAAVLMIGMGVVSRSCELEADARACEIAGEQCDWAAGETTVAQEIFVRALEKTVDPEHQTARSWMHPSLKERISHLAKISSEKRQKASEQKGVLYA